jgi:hypothetical protein
MTDEFEGSHFERDVILWGVRWYVAYPISYRQMEEMMGERGVEVDHSTLNRWVLKYVPALEKAFLARKRPVGRSWRLDETYVRVKDDAFIVPPGTTASSGVMRLSASVGMDRWLTGMRPSQTWGCYAALLNGRWAHRSAAV